MKTLIALCAAVAVAIPAGALAQSPSPVRITHSSDGPQSQVLTLGIGKAAIVDLPADARDVLISNPDVADAVVRSARRVFVIGRQLGATNAFFFDANGRRIASLEIRISPDLGALNDLFRQALNADTDVKAQAVNDTIVLTGTVANSGEADRAVRIAERFVASSQASAGGSGGAANPLAALMGGSAETGASSSGSGSNLVNLLTIQGEDQVMVKVRIVEMSRTLARQLGVQLNRDPLTGLPTGGSEFNTLNRVDVEGGLRTVLNVLGSDELDVDAAIAAFERIGLVRVLAEPNLAAVSGEAARFLAGGEFPARRGFDEQGRPVFEYRPFGVGLAFTPVVLSSGRISLKLSTEVSERTGETVEGAGDDLEVRRAETTVEMASGASLVIAGLIQERLRDQVEGVPGAMRVPVLGSLFRSRETTNRETELVIIVTPYLVRPTRPDALVTPGAGFAQPNSAAALFVNRLNAVYRNTAAAAPAGSLQGPIGFALPAADAEGVVTP